MVNCPAGLAYKLT